MANMLRQAQAENLSKQSVILKYIGEKFRLKIMLPEWYTDKQIAEFLLRYVLYRIICFPNSLCGISTRQLKLLLRKAMLVYLRYIT